MNRVRHGSLVTVQYIGTVDNGRIFDSTTDEEPLVFTVGGDQVFPGLQQAVIGMSVGDVKNIIISATDAFGERSDENIIKVARNQFPAEKIISIGQKLSIQFRDGRELLMLVIDVNDDFVTLDGNHPLAGLDLTFALRLDKVENHD